MYYHDYYHQFILIIIILLLNFTHKMMFYIKGAAKLTKEDIEKVFALYDRVCI